MFRNIRAEMARNSKTVKEMAKFLSLSDNGFSFKLNGKNQFTLAEMEKLADYFDCSIDYLAGRTMERHGIFPQLVEMQNVANDSKSATPA